VSSLQSKVTSLLTKAEKQESISLIDGCISFSVEYVLESGFKVSGVALYLENNAFTLLEARAIAKEHAISSLLKLEEYAECQRVHEERKVFTGTPIALNPNPKRALFALDKNQQLIPACNSVVEKAEEGDDRRNQVFKDLMVLTEELGEDSPYEAYAWGWDAMTLQDLEKELESQKKRLQRRNGSTSRDTPSLELKTEVHAPKNIDIKKLKEDMERSVREAIIREQKPRGLLSDRGSGEDNLHYKMERTQAEYLQKDFSDKDPDWERE
jgi:hypothetical protein